MATGTDDIPMKILPPNVVKNKKKVVVTSKRIELANLKKERERIGKKIWNKHLWCGDYGTWKPIEFCYFRCGEIGDACQFFHVYRWVCIYKRCKFLDRCRKKKNFCLESKGQVKLIKKYLELYIRWRRMKLKMEQEKKTKK